MNSSPSWERRASEKPPKDETSAISCTPCHVVRHDDQMTAARSNLNVIAFFKKQANRRIHQVIILDDELIKLLKNIIPDKTRLLHYIAEIDLGSVSNHLLGLPNQPNEELVGQRGEGSIHD
jgi:hypothetical protein